MQVVYGVQWIEVEFGQRCEGWKVYLDKEKCIEDTQRGSQEGPYDGGYFGPARPLRMYEIPFECLDKKDQTNLKARTSKGQVFTDKSWMPKFKDSGTAIPYK